MSSTKHVLLIDAGNTQLKVCSVVDGAIQLTKRFSNNDIEFINFIEQYGNIPKVLCSVLSKQDTDKLRHTLSPCFKLSHQTPLPVILDYDTPETLGFDRICNVCAILELSKTQVSVSIDIGTCIKFDVLEGNEYKGGSISPGIDLRYRAMNEFTGKLPLLNERSKIKLTGKSTAQSMHSGVINGIQCELDGFIGAYKERYPELTFFITGGDAVHFDFEGKSDIFVIDNLTLLGMYTIYTFNAK
jgi:type III pantothenate kinase